MAMLAGIAAWGMRGLIGTVREVALVAVVVGIASFIPGHTFGAALPGADGFSAGAAAAAYTVGSIRYDLDTAPTPAIRGIRFTLTGGRAASAKASVDADASVWYPCSSTDGGSAWRCDAPSGQAISAHDAVALRVILHD